MSSGYITRCPYTHFFNILSQDCRLTCSCKNYYKSHISFTQFSLIVTSCRIIVEYHHWKFTAKQSFALIRISSVVLVARVCVYVRECACVFSAEGIRASPASAWWGMKGQLPAPS